MRCGFITWKARDTDAPSLTSRVHSTDTLLILGVSFRIVGQRAMAEDCKSFTVRLRDISQGMVQAWEEVFGDPRYANKVEVSVRAVELVLQFTIYSTLQNTYEGKLFYTCGIRVGLCYASSFGW